MSSGTVSRTLTMEEREQSLRRKTPGSLARVERSLRSLAGGVSSGLRRHVRPYLLFFESGKGSRVRDVDGNEYLDYGLAWGPLILGHAPDAVVEAMRAQCGRDLTFGAQHDLEYQMAELLQDIVPCADLVTFANAGTDVVQVALRLARAVTGRLKYLKFEGHYHGWGDQTLVSYHPAAGEGFDGSTRTPVGVGKGQLPHHYVTIAEWNNPAEVELAFQRHGHEISAVICEPMLANSGSIPADPGFLQFVRDISSRNGALLIFDEVITGLRIDLGGAQTRYGVIPDLATYAKAVGAGVPLSVLAGRREYMDWIARGDVIHAGSLNGNPVTLAGAYAGLQELHRNAATIYPRIRTLGQKLAAGVVDALRANGHDAVATGDGPVFSIHLQANAPRTYRDTLASDKGKWSDFVLALLDEGVLLLPDGRWYISAAHSESDIDQTLAAAHRAAQSLAH